MKYLTLVSVLLLTGCASLWDAGNARYHVTPVFDKDGKPHCCDVDVRNGKELAHVKAHIKMGKDGEIEVYLEEDGVAAFEGQKTAAFVAQEAAKVATTAAMIGGGVLIAPIAAPALGAAIGSAGLPAAAAGAAIGAAAASGGNP
jgi:hypothetical protein